MIKNYFLFLLSVVLISGTMNAQETETRMDDSSSDEETSIIFTPKPKNMWEVGIQGGHMFISGDVDPKLLGGYGIGLHLRKAFNYTFSARVDFNYGSAKGRDGRAMNGAVVSQDWGNDNSLPQYTGSYYRNYKTTFIEGSLLGVLNLGNILFHAPENKWNGYLLAGVGLYSYTTNVNALNGTSKYDFSSVDAAGESLESSIEKRKAKRDALESLLDDTYETVVPLSKGAFALNDDNDVRFNYQVGFGVARKINERFNIALEHKIILSGNDYLDGHRYRSTQDLTNNDDYINYTALHLNFNLGRKDKNVEPLYWVNPLVAPMTDLAEVKARPILDLTDKDNDGVIDMWDEDPETEEGVAVDVKGNALDIDGDGIPDHLDKEMFSPSGYDVDEDGVAIIDDPYLTESEIKDILDNRLADLRMNWFLPMIHFDLDKYFVKPEFSASLKHVANVINDNPSIKIVVEGYTDVRAKPEYNKVLSYKRAEATIDYLVNNYGVDRNRLILNYGGENEPLVPGLPESHNISKEKEYLQYMNRRVEFRVAKSGDAEMQKPDGPDAGSGTPGSSRAGSKYSGNRNSGY